MRFTDTEMKAILLADDATATGGISHSGETLWEFCEESDLTEADHTEINKALKECGILPVAPCGKNPYEIIRNATERGILSDDYCDVYDVLAWVFDRCDNPKRDLDDILDEYEDMEAY